MKKIICTVLAVTAVISAAVLHVGATSYNPSGYTSIRMDIKHADPEYVIKDGIIGENEYERYEIPDSFEDSCLNIVMGSGVRSYENALKMYSSIEYYFSWDEIHGFNIAVKCKPPVYEQNIPQGTGEKPGDDFLCNLGIQIQLSNVSIPESDSRFYYAVSKNREDGTYLEGHYRQLGRTGSYDPEPGKDYEVTFCDDGFIIYEWSVPLENMFAHPRVGSKIFFTVCVMAGTDTPGNLYANCYGISLGDRGFLVLQNDNSKFAVGTLSDETIDPDGYSDISSDDWFFDEVMYAVKNGLMTGRDKKLFVPDGKMTRAELVTVLYRMENEPDVDYSPVFPDVSYNQWFTPAVMWAAENSVVLGFDDGTFKPNENVTRDQMTAILYRYAESSGKDVSAEAKLDRFADASDVQEWAQKSLKWAVAEGIINGKPSKAGTVIAPKDNASRAEAATVIMRYLEGTVNG